MEEFIRKYSGDNVYAFLKRNGYLSSDSLMVVATGESINLINPQQNEYKTLINLKRVNQIKNVNDFFKTANRVLEKNGIFISCAESMEQRKKRIIKKYPLPFNYFYFFFDYILKRVLPKIKFTRWFYLWITDDRNRVMSVPEIMGRLYYAGFVEESHVHIDGYVYFVYRKQKEPEKDEKPSYGPLLKIKRVGMHGKKITVYKLRTMVPYAEFIQHYVYDQNKLKEGGKINDDYRITHTGKILRKFWLDEIPMVWNWLKGEINLIGVRPLSPHYLSLYDKDLQELRASVKPGLLPPFYADMPKTLDEIMDSERRYLEQYKKHPFKTNLRYFFRIMKNILFHGKRSS